MLKFTKLNASNYSRIQRILRFCPYKLSDYTLGFCELWDSLIHPEFAFLDDALIIKTNENQQASFLYPIPITQDFNEDVALKEIEHYCMDQYIPLRFHSIPEQKIATLSNRYKNFSVESNRDDSEYLYLSESFITYSGKHYSGQRNHVHKFYNSYTDATFKPYTESDLPLLLDFFNQFTYPSEKEFSFAQVELERVKEYLQTPHSTMSIGYMEVDGKMVSIALGELEGDTMVIHIEKALYEYEGVYPATAQAFAQMFCKNVQFINREEDMGDMGLRKSKTQYRPIALLSRVTFTPHNELENVKEIPGLSSERLSFKELLKEYQKEYNAICLDEDLNRFWGYDYKEDCRKPKLDYFIHVAKEDFKKHTAINFGIFYQERLIGEILLYDFDYQGSCQIGVRIIKIAGGHGFGKESLNRIIEYGLYTLNLHVIKAKCFKENIPSYKMLSSVMTKTNEDDRFYYFEQTT